MKSLRINNSDSSEIENKNKNVTSMFLYFTAFVVTTASNVTLGAMVTWLSPVAPKLLSDDPDVNPLSQPITTVQLSIIGAIPGIGYIIGPLVVYQLFDKFGRKTMLTVITLLAIAALILMAYARNIYMLCLGFSVNIVCLGAAGVGLTIYLSEISEDHDRAKLQCIGNIGLPLGNVLCFISSSISSSVKGFTLILAGPAAVCLVLVFLFLPETPVHLASKGRLNEASEALKKLRKKTPEALQMELKYIMHILQETSGSGKVGFKTLFSDSAVRGAMMATLGVHLVNFLCGPPVIMTYLTIILGQAGTGISIKFSTILLTSLQLVASCGATQVAGRFGRKTLLVSSMMVCTMMLSSLGIFFFLKNLETALTAYLYWLPMVTLVFFFTSNSLGIGSVCWIIASEMFPSNVISTAVSIIIFCDGLAVSVSLFCFPLLMETLGIPWIFCTYSVMFLLGIIFVYFKVPETRGKNILEIQKMLR